jgi:hypothetical protein
MTTLRKLSGPFTRALACLLASALLLWGVNKGPDGASYMASDGTVYSFIELASGGSSSVLAGADDDVALLTLPFPFQFYGNSYTLLCVSSNGLISFVASAAACTAQTDFANTDLTATAPPGNLPSLLPYWSDLTFQTAGSGGVFYRSQGPIGSRKFVVEWSNAFPQGAQSAVTFEVVLSEGVNSILFQYQTVDLGAGNPISNGARATVGIRDANGNTNNRQIAWSFDAAVLTNAGAIVFTPPASGQTSVNTIISNPPGLTVSIDGTPTVTPKVVSWTPGTPHTLAVTSPQTNGGTQNTFTGWSTNATTLSIQVNAASPGTVYTANFSTKYQLTTAVNPANGGTITAGGLFAPGASVPVQATAAANFVFSNFSGDLSGTTNPQNVIMNGPRNVVANFRSGGTPTLTASIAGKADGTAGARIWTIRLTNTGLGIAAGTQITGVVLTQTAGTPCSPAATVGSTFPVPVGDIAASANATATVTLNMGGCTDTTDRFSAKVSFSANSGAYSNATTIANQTK